MKLIVRGFCLLRTAAEAAVNRIRLQASHNDLKVCGLMLEWVRQLYDIEEARQVANRKRDDRQKRREKIAAAAKRAANNTGI